MSRLAHKVLAGIPDKQCFQGIGVRLHRHIYCQKVKQNVKAMGYLSL